MREFTEFAEDLPTWRQRLMRWLGIAVGPPGPRGYPGPQGNSGIAHVVVVDKDGHKLMSREEFEKRFGKL